MVEGDALMEQPVELAMQVLCVTETVQMEMRAKVWQGSLGLSLHCPACDHDSQLSPEKYKKKVTGNQVGPGI